MKIAIVETYYPDFLNGLPLVKGQRSYEQELNAVLDMRFGTHSAYSTALKMLNHECIDIIANHQGLQNLWAIENDCEGLCGFPRAIAMERIRRFDPDVVFCQDLSFFAEEQLSAIRNRFLLAAQCSCRIDDDKLKQFDVVFSSFPFYIQRLEALGVKGVFLPLAFDPIVIERAKVPPARTYPVSFVGGVGSHWNTYELFTTLERQTPIQFWGYGQNEWAGLRYKGPAWGLKMYEIYLGSHIVLNRHGGISQGYSNNLRMFEATGCGAMLLTEDSPNIRDYFAKDECVTYASPLDAADKINYYLDHHDEMLAIASKGQQRTLSTHTYYQRMPIVAKVLTECLDRKQVSA